LWILNSAFAGIVSVARLKRCGRLAVNRRKAENVGLWSDRSEWLEGALNRELATQTNPL
jgi:hypothetical protein